jgi:hypothetical protein
MPESAIGGIARLCVVAPRLDAKLEPLAGHA